jgi:hypothetical protein
MLTQGEAGSDALARPKHQLTPERKLGERDWRCCGGDLPCRWPSPRARGGWEASGAPPLEPSCWRPRSAASGSVSGEGDTLT